MKLYDDLEEHRKDFLERNAAMDNRFESDTINKIFDELSALREVLEKCNDITIPKFDKYKPKVDSNE